MAKAYMVVSYHSVSDEAALKEYARLAGPATEGAGGRYRGERGTHPALDDGSAAAPASRIATVS